MPQDTRKAFDLFNPDISAGLGPEEDVQIAISDDLNEFPLVPEGSYTVTGSIGERQGYTDRTKEKPGKPSRAYRAIHVVHKIVGHAAVTGVLHEDISDLTFTNKEGKVGTRMANFYAAFGEPGDVPLSQLPFKVALGLKGSPKYGIRVRWEGFCKNCENDPKTKGITLKGQAAFRGERRANCPQCGSEVEARPKVAGYYRVKADAPVAAMASTFIA